MLCTGQFFSAGSGCEMCPAGSAVSQHNDACVQRSAAPSTNTTTAEPDARDVCIVLIARLLLGVHLAAVAWSTGSWLCRRSVTQSQSARKLLAYDHTIAACFACSATSLGVSAILIECSGSCTASQHLAPAVTAVFCTCPVPYILQRTLRKETSTERPPSQAILPVPAVPKPRPNIRLRGEFVRALPSVPSNRAAPQLPPRPSPAVAEDPAVQVHQAAEGSRDDGIDGSDPVAVNLALSTRMRGGKARDVREGRGYDRRQLTVVTPPLDAIDDLDAPQMPPPVTTIHDDQPSARDQDHLGHWPEGMRQQFRMEMEVNPVGPSARQQPEPAPEPEPQHRAKRVKPPPGRPSRPKTEQRGRKSEPLRRTET